MDNSKLEWLRVLGVKLERSDEDSSAAGSPAGEELLPSLSPLLPGSLMDFDDGTVYADVGSGSAADDPVKKKLETDLAPMLPDLQKAKLILPATPAIKTLLKKFIPLRDNVGKKIAASDFAGAAALLPALKAALKELLDAAAAQDKEKLPQATAAESTVKDLVSKNKLAGKTNAGKIELLRQLQGPATRKPEFRAAQGEIYKTLALDKKFKEEDEKKRGQVVKTLIATPKDKADLKDKRAKWAEVGKDGKPVLSENDKIALLKKALEAQCKVLDISVPEIVPEHIAEIKQTQPDGTELVMNVNGGFNSEDGKIHVNFGDPKAKVNDFERALDLIFHENSHHYQAELVKKLKDKNKGKKLTEKDPEYEEALLFEINSDAGYINPWEDKAVYEKQPKEEHSRLNGPETAKLVIKELN